MRAALWLVPLAACSGRGPADAGFDAGYQPSCAEIFGERSTQVCLRWQCDRADVREGAWAGSTTACMPADLAIEGRENALKLINLYRFIAGLPAVETSAMRDSAAQSCALMMHAAGRLDHRPDAGWPCYTPSGAQAAGSSNLSSGPAVQAIDGYMHDDGNAQTLGHRRWLLAATLGPIGIGGTTGASCHWVTGGTTSTPRRFVAWPPPGPVPLDALTTTRADQTGWSVHAFSNADDLAGATVAVLDQGVDAPVDVVQLQRDYGSRYAIGFKPRGWTAQAGHAYVINVNAPAIMANPIVYTVEVVGCP